MKTKLSFLIFCHESIQLLDQNLKNNEKITIFQILIQKKSGNAFFLFRKSYKIILFDAKNHF